MGDSRRKPEMVGHADVDLRPGTRQDPAIELMLRHVEAGEVTLGAVHSLWRPLREAGIVVTVEIMAGIIERAKQRFRPRPPVPPKVPRKRVIGGYWHGIEYVGGEVVYYMRVGNRVKIGTTCQLGNRLRQINPEELLATEPGGLSRERQRHREFKALRTHGEWFELGSPLTEHIAELREKLGAKKIGATYLRRKP